MVTSPTKKSIQIQDTEEECFTSVVPKAALSTVAAQIGVKVSDLYTLTVSANTSHLYQAITEYAVLSEGENCCNFEPPLKDNLIVLPEDPYELDIDESDDSGDETGMYRKSLARLVRERSRKAALRSGKRKGKVPTPKYKHGLGTGTFFWPPLNHLTGEKLSKDRSEREYLKNQREKAVWERVSFTETHQDSFEHELSNTAIGTPVTADTDSDSETSKVSYETRTQFVFVHYAIGEPQKSTCKQLIVQERQVLVATVEGSNALRTFSREIVEWLSDRNFRNTDGHKYTLYRFKTCRFGNYWRDEGLKRPRSADSVVLPGNQLESILNDVAEFLDPISKKWFMKRGLPHRRSYLFYGPPGTGKTSTIRVIASTFGLNCCYLSMTDSEFSNQSLADALSEIPPNALLVIEDVDALFNEDRKNEHSNNLTFSGLLNALDGVISVDGVVTVMTTNHIERLDRALVRGGRVDRRIHFGHPSQVQIERLFKYFYPDADDRRAAEFAEIIFCRPEGHEGRSIATLQQMFIQYKGASAEECIAAIPEFYETHFPTGSEEKQYNLFA